MQKRLKRRTRSTSPNAHKSHVEADLKLNSKLAGNGNEGMLHKGEWFQTSSAPTQRLRDRLWTEVKSA